MAIGNIISETNYNQMAEEDNLALYLAVLAYLSTEFRKVYVDLVGLLGVGSCLDKMSSQQIHGWLMIEGNGLMELIGKFPTFCSVGYGSGFYSMQNKLGQLIQPDHYLGRVLVAPPSVDA